MSDDRGPRRIEIPADVAEEESVPDDLDATALGPYSVPDVARRRRAGVVYAVGGVVLAALTGAGVFPPSGWIAAGALGAVAGYHRLTGWHLEVREGTALEIANTATAFAVGHASAALSFEGVRSRPVWNVLVFSADEPPSRRALIRVDGIDGSVLDSYEEAIPEAEWTSSG